MLSGGNHNSIGFKMKRMIKVKTSSGQQDRNIKRIIDSYRNSKAIQSNKENRPNFPKQLKRSSDCFQQAQIKMLKYSMKNKQNTNRDNEHFKSQYKSSNKMLSQNAYELQGLGQNSSHQRGKIQRQIVSIDRNIGQMNLNNLHNFNSKINKNSTKFNENSVQSKNISNTSQRKQNRLLNLSIRRMQKIKSYNNTKVKTQRLSQSQNQQRRIFYQASSIKGSKQYNQDSVKAGDGVWIVCDGHGEHGHDVSWYVVNVLYEILEHRRIKEKVTKAMLNQVFIDAQKHLEQSGIQISLSGSTCVLVVFEGQKLFCACIGDSVAIAISQDQTYTIISSEHKPCNPQQAKRIEFFGGVIKKTCGKEHLPGSPLRMWGHGVDHWGPGLAISRSFGDKMGQKYGLIYEPEIKELDISKDIRYIVLGSDGLFDQVSPSEMANILQIQSQHNQQKPQGCKMLTQIAQSRWMGYSDDISAIVIYL